MENTSRELTESPPMLLELRLRVAPLFSTWCRGRCRDAIWYSTHIPEMTDGVLLCRLGWSAVVQSQLSATSASQVQAILMPQPPEQLELQHVLFVEKGSCFVTQAGVAGVRSQLTAISASRVQAILVPQPPEPGDSRQRSHTGHQHGSCGRHGCFASASVRRFPVRSVQDWMPF
ncbi:hypothetical protein AAY473_025098 [Plecturocebus cupreus]